MNRGSFLIKKYLFLWQINKNSTKIIKASDEIQGNINSTEKSCSIQTVIENPTAIMKATATVSPLFDFEMRSNKRSNSPPASEEGSFAAALRKLAQQTPNFPGLRSGGFQISSTLRERLNSSPPSKGILHLQRFTLTRCRILFNMTEYFFTTPVVLFFQFFFFLFFCTFNSFFFFYFQIQFFSFLLF